MKQILWISLRAPYDLVPHGGGKTHNFYIKKFNESKKFNIHLLSFCYESEKEKAQIDLNNYGISNDISVIKRNEFLRNFLGKIGLPISLLEYRFVIKEIKRKATSLRDKGYNPDFIFLHWTEIVMMSRYIKKIFPSSKLISIEEDVTFLKLQRKYLMGRGVKKLLLLFQYRVIRRKELNGLKDSTLVVLNNHKDYELVVSHGIEKNKAFETSPYFEDFSYIKRRPVKGNIIFWGAMNRPENIEAVLWFVNNVWEFLENTKFVVVGAKPPQKIIDLKEKDVEVTGFVNSPDQYFEDCMCMVVPLQMGAGIKIKVLEAMSAGVPVLTNSIGIEGIKAKNGVDYFFCEKPEEFKEAIEEIMYDFSVGQKIGNNAKRNIKKNYSINEDILKFINKVENL